LYILDVNLHHKLLDPKANVTEYLKVKRVFKDATKHLISDRDLKAVECMHSITHFILRVAHFRDDEGRDQKVSEIMRELQSQTREYNQWATNTRANKTQVLDVSVCSLFTMTNLVDIYENSRENFYSYGDSILKVIKCFVSGFLAQIHNGRFQFKIDNQFK
jgi:hypothetical protein